MMVADGPLVSVFSRLALAVAVDSQWFSVDLSSAEEFSYGRQKGCRMFDLEYQEAPLAEFCMFRNDQSCSENGRFVNKCLWNVFTGENYLNMPMKACHKAKASNVNSQSDPSHDAMCLEMQVEGGGRAEWGLGCTGRKRAQGRGITPGG